MKVIVFTIALLLVSSALADTDVKIKITSSDIVEETFKISFESDQAYDAFSYETSKKPLSIAYEGTYTLTRYAGSYLITFDKEILLGQNEITFTLLYDDLVSNGDEKMFRTRINSQGPTKITLSLPPGSMLAGDPSTTPEALVSTDGEKLTLEWMFSQNDDPAVVVFYNIPIDSKLPYLLAASVAILAMAGAWYYTKKKVSKEVSAILTPDEQAVVAELKRGLTKQSDIAKTLGYSKSKMSKVLRKLEQKELIEKKPHFKTNILKLKKI